jgi:hypothetical protein
MSSHDMILPRSTLRTKRGHFSRDVWHSVGAISKKEWALIIRTSALALSRPFIELYNVMRVQDMPGRRHNSNMDTPPNSHRWLFLIVVWPHKDVALIA